MHYMKEMEGTASMDGWMGRGGKRAEQGNKVFNDERKKGRKEKRLKSKMNLFYRRPKYDRWKSSTAPRLASSAPLVRRAWLVLTAAATLASSAEAF